MNPLSVTRLVLRRVLDDRMLPASIFIGITLAATLAAAAPVYVKSLDRLALDLEIDKFGALNTDINTFASNIPLTRDKLTETEEALGEALRSHISPAAERRERYLIVRTYLAGMPDRPLPEAGADEPRASRAYFRSYSNLEQHLTFVEGRMAGSAVSIGPEGPVLEAVVSSETAQVFGLSVDDIITVAPDLGSPTRLSARIVGIVSATDRAERYWRPHASVFLDPPPPVDIDGEAGEFDPALRVVPLFITQEAMVEGVGRAYPGTLIDSVWFIRVDAERLKQWSISEVRHRLEDFETAVSKAMPGSDVSTLITRLLNSFETRSFFSRVPLLLLLVVTIVTVLLYLFMMVSYLVQSKERDAALLRTRGAGAAQFLRLYAVEGVVTTAAAVALAPFLAIGAVAIAGKLPYFNRMTGGDPLPVEVGPAPFLVALGAGAFCLSFLVLSTVLGGRGGLLAHKLALSRPPTVPFFHRYYIDVGVLALGGLVFWELQSRGHIISGGLFNDVSINETMLLAPVLFLIAVALLFMRFFPLLVRFVSGESPALLHLVFAITAGALALAILVQEVGDGNVIGWLGPVVFLAALAGTYWATQRATHMRYVVAGLAIQAGLAVSVLLQAGYGLCVAASCWLQDPAFGQESPLEEPLARILIAVVPAQIVFLVARDLATRAPVWLSMGLWHMARNPMQYTWLVLLMVFVTGLGILSTTVGGTLQRSQRERVLYDVAADLRVADVQTYLAGGTRTLKERFLGIPGVTSVSRAFRGNGRAGAANVQVLAVESQEFPYMSWYRSDFSTHSLGAVMRSIQSLAPVRRVTIPEGATTIGVWAKPDDPLSNMSILMVVQDNLGTMTSLSLGRLDRPEWQLMRATVPSRLAPPLSLVSVQVYEVGQGLFQTPGTLLLDDIHATIGDGAEEHLVEGFESQTGWMPIATSLLSSDSVTITRADVHGGNRAVEFDFGGDNIQGVRGIYQSPTGGPMPVVLSSSLAEASQRSVGDVLLAEVADRPIPVRITDTVHYFPTMGADSGGFMLADLDSLLAHLNIVSLVTPVRPNELFIAEAPAAHQAVREALVSISGWSGEVYDKTTRLESVRTDPIANAGWRSMVLVSLGVVILAAGLGYVTYVLSFAVRSKPEMGYLQSLGVSRRQLLALLGFEHMAVALLGIGLGTWAGFQTSGLTVSSVSVTEGGDQVVPPFVLMTDWSLMLPTYAALLGVFVAALFVLNRAIRRLDLHTISRVEGL